MPTITDMHCHVLPGVDDGPATMDESIAILTEAVRQGIRTMVVTPHFHPGRYQVNAELVYDKIEEVREELEIEQLPLRLIPGQECYYFSGLVRELDAGNALTMGGTNYVLVEFDPSVIYNQIQHAMRELFSSGYRPIIAHFERYRCLTGREDRLEELRSNGAMLQMNFDRLLDKEGIFRRNPWRRLLRDGFVDFLGSDTHGMGFRPLHAKQAVAWLRSEVDPELVHQILQRNISLLTDGD